MAQIILDSNSNLIQGDFDSATVNNRTKLQTSTTNATTGVYVVPNGSATSASVQVSNAADPTNASKVVVATNGTTDTQIVSGANGSGSYLPLSFYTNNDIRFQMGNAGELNVRTAPGTVSSGTSGQVLTSGGPAAGVSWTTLSGYAGPNFQAFTSPGTFTVPPGITRVKVTVIGGGGGGTTYNTGVGGSGAGGGAGGLNINFVTGLTPGGTVPVTVGAAGAGAGNNATPAATPGGTSSFGPGGSPAVTITATGGGGAVAGATSTGGTGGSGGGYGGVLIAGSVTAQDTAGATINKNVTGASAKGTPSTGYDIWACRSGNNSPGAAGTTGGTGLVGGGGGGHSNFPGTGGAGGGGLVLVEY
jgi:hypothetical protein